MKYLIEKGVSIHAKSEYNKTALHYAASSGYKDIVKYLIEKDADINAKDSNNSTALHFAAKHTLKENSLKKFKKYLDFYEKS